LKTPTLSLQSLALASTLLLAACGGGGSSSAAVTPAGSTLTLTGVVSVGPAVASAPVQITCATGTASATTGAGGTYSAGITSGALPCVLRATTSTGSLLHSVAAGTGTTATANITPLTELVTANVAGGNPDTLYTTFNAAAQAKVTPTTVATAITTTAAALAGTVDLAGANPLTDALTVSTSGTSGNAADQLIDQLNNAITVSQTTLAAVTAAVSIAQPNTLPIFPTVAAQATSCASLRSGTYRTLDPHESVDDPAGESLLLNIDAAALTATDTGQGNDTAVTQLTAVTGSPCSFTFPGDYGTGTALVSTGGMIVVRTPSVTGPIRTSFIVPNQTVPLARLAGNWNFITYQRTYDTPTSPLTAGNGTAVLDASGNFLSGTVCNGLTCTPAVATDLPAALTVDANGGFDSADSPGPDRLFAVIADNGAKTIFMLFPGEGGISVLTQQQTLTLPAVGSVTNYWDFDVGSGAFEWAPANNADGGASALADYSITVTSVDTAAQSYTRLRASDQRVDTFLINNPRDGVRNRVANGTVSATFAMPLAGWGVVLSTNVTATGNFLDVSVDHL
jgi:hypothetical protein